MPKDQETVTVKKMKQEIIKRKSKAQSKGHPPVANESSPEVSNEPENNLSIGNQLDTEECLGTPKNSISKVYKGCISKEGLNKLISSGLSEKQIEDNLEVLLEVYRSEGIKPNPARLADEIMQLARDAG